MNADERNAVYRHPPFFSVLSVPLCAAFFFSSPRPRVRSSEWLFHVEETG